MTLVCAKNILYRFLINNDVLDISSDLDKILLSDSRITLNSKLDSAILDSAAKVFVKANLLTEIELDDKTVYVLQKPLSQYEQTIELSAPTISTIASIINSECDRLKMDSARVDCMNLTEKDVLNLILIASRPTETKEDE